MEKGSRIELEGQLHVRSYEKDGKKIYVTEVYVDDCHLQKKATVESVDIGFESEAPFGFEE
ncbi:hypothetical protein RGT18_15340 [Solobacterium moorei]|nr:hypothetical protein RGT18_15340 [Solobacterium moorei]